MASAQAAETAATANLAEATLTAPFAGTVGQVNVSVGQVVAPAGQTTGNSGSGDITLIGDGGFEADVAVPDSEIGQVHVGDKAWVTPAGGVAPVQAVATQITPQATPGSGSNGPTFPVTLSIQGSVRGLLAGESAEVSIQPGG